MAQATRCPHCQTAFKVVRDQLLLREGWVRCGHCGEPFNALDHLIDLNPPAPPPEPAQPPPALPEQAHAEAPSPTSTVPIIAGLRWDHISVDLPAYQGFLPLSAHAYDSRPAPQLAPKTESNAGDFGNHTAPERHPPPQGNALDHARPENDSVLADLDPAAAPLSEFNLNEALNYHFDADDNLPATAATRLAQEPQFMRQAHRQARWNRTPVRVALGVFSLLLLLLLAGQAALFWRDTLAQQWPASRPWLQQLCRATTGCELAAPRNLDALIIDSSALNPAQTGLQLTVLLRNRLDRAVAWPALELTLTDAQGRIEQRKVMEPEQYLPSAQATASTLRAGIAPGQQMQLQLHLLVSGAAPAGYKLVLFYP